MKKNSKVLLIIMVLLAIFFMLLIIGPEMSRSIEAANYIDLEQSKNTSSDGGLVIDQSGNNLDPPVKEDEEAATSDVYEETIDHKAPFQLKYEKYPRTFIYFVIEKDRVDVLKGPSEDEAVLKVASRNEKLDYYETVQKDEIWYHVTWKQKDQTYFGFVRGQDVSKRTFQFDKMMGMIETADQEFTLGSLTHIGNYKNQKGYAPEYYGSGMDKDGNRRSQSAPGYPDLANLKEFSYLGDGTLVRVISQGSDYTRVSVLANGKQYSVPNKYIPAIKTIQAINKVIAIDRKNQNEVVFEKLEGQWKIVSYTLATTGKIGPYHVPTPLGYFMAIEKREFFYYYKDGTTTIQGYAPHVIRFAGGAYVHGVPVDYKYNKEGKRIDPGRVEYSGSMGTIPLSHKCVRNYTSHVKFLYDWYTKGETIVIVME